MKPSSAVNDNLIKQTITLEARGQRDLVREDSRQIIGNVTGFFSILREWSRAETRASATTIIAPHQLSRLETSETPGVMMPHRGHTSVLDEKQQQIPAQSQLTPKLDQELRGALPQGRRGRQPPQEHISMNKLVTVNNVVPYDADVDLEVLRESVSRHSLFPGEWVKFRKGSWLVGQEERAASLTEPFIAHVGEVLVGWTKIVDGVVVGRIAGRLADKFRVPPREQLGDEQMIGENDPWKPMTAMVMRDASGDVFTFTTLSISGRMAVMKLLDQFLRKCHQFPGKFPAVLLGVGPGRSKQFNSEYPVPVFKIVSWEPWNLEARANPAGAQQQQKASAPQGQSGKQVEATANKPLPADGGTTNAVAWEDPAKSTEELMADEIPF